MLVKNISSVLFLGAGFASFAAAGVVDDVISARSMRARQNIEARGFGRGGFGGFHQKQSNNNNNNNNNGNGNGNGNNNGGSNTNTGSADNSNQSNNGGNSNGGALLLLQSNVQNGSDSTGQVGTPEAGQADSATDPANFINFCTGKTLTNGLQVKGGSCNGVVMGDIPSSANMISSLILNPGPGDNIAANTEFNINVAVSNLQAGSFTNAAATYYSAPQQLNAQGQVIGHTHVTVQDMGNSLTPGATLDPGVFAFFKGINDAGSGGVLSATVAGGLPAGNYRVCTMTSASNHQPVLMPVAQRGAQDDCQKFTVGGAGSATSSSAGSVSSDTAASVANSPAASNATAGNSQKATNNGNGRGHKFRGGRNRRE